MKDYYEKIFDLVVKKGDERLRRENEKKADRMRITFIVTGLCAAFIVGLGIWHNNNIKNLIDSDIDDTDMIIDPSINVVTSVTTKEEDIVVTSTNASYAAQSTTSVEVTKYPGTKTSVSSTVASDNATRSHTTSRPQNEKNEQSPEIVTTVKITDVRINAPDSETISSKFSEIVSDGITYKLQYSDISSSTIGTRRKTVDITNVDITENKRYIISAEIYDVSVESSEKMIAVKYSHSDEIYLYYALSDDRFSMDWVKFSMPFGKYESGYVSCGTQCVAGEKIGDYLENVSLKGRNDFTNEDISVLGKVYRIKNISSDCALVVRYDNDGEYHLFRNIMYQPETLGQLIDDMDLENEMVINGVYVNDSFYKIEPIKVWDHLLYDDNAERNGQGMTPTDYSVSVDIPVLGRKNVAINVYSNGQISTNIVERVASFNIGKKNAENFFEYVNQYGIKSEKQENYNSMSIEE